MQLSITKRNLRGLGCRLAGDQRMQLLAIDRDSEPAAAYSAGFVARKSRACMLARAKKLQLLAALRAYAV